VFNRGGKSGPPTFSSKKTKGGISLDAEAFPELGEAQTSGKKANPEGSKADSANIGQFGAMAQKRDGAEESKK